VGSTIPLFGVYRDALMDAAALEVLRSGQIAAGPYISRFEDGFGKVANQANVVAVNDMSSAIQIALRVIGVGPGDEVLASPYACMSTNAPIVSVGATPVWVDIDPQTGNMDPVDLERSITPRSKAVLLYHLAGYPADVRRIANICKARGVKLIEDCDNALLATVGGTQVGSFGDFAVYSFYPNRQINATEGGALCCRQRFDADRAVRLRRYGIDLTRFRQANGEIDPNCDVSEVGWAATLNNLCSAIGFVQLGGVEGRIERARLVAAELSNRLRNLPGIRVVNPLPEAIPSYWSFLVCVRDRDALLAELHRRGVKVSKLHYRTDKYSGFGGHRRALPNTGAFLDEVLALPCGWWIEDQDIDYIVDSISDFLAGSAKA
jgi:perosamine synthetase